jgi:hypothetical protein
MFYYLHNSRNFKFTCGTHYMSDEAELVDWETKKKFPWMQQKEKGRK